MITAFTTFVAVDSAHLYEWRLSIETWRLNRPEIWRNPMVVICDGDLDLSFVRHPDLAVVFARYCPGTQREKMLTALTVVPANSTTPWWLKLDTDVVAERGGPWIEEGWFQRNVLVASPWGYTKPAEWMRQLDEWADTRPELASLSPPARSYDRAKNIARCKRIISYVMFGRTDWTADVVSLLDGGRLPCPSQDTFLWYCADRMRSPYLRVRMSHFGWVHCWSSQTRVRTSCQNAVYRT